MNSGASRTMKYLAMDAVSKLEPCNTCHGEGSIPSWRNPPAKVKRDYEPLHQILDYIILASGPILAVFFLPIISIGLMKALGFVWNLTGLLAIGEQGMDFLEFLGVILAGLATIAAIVGWVFALWENDEPPFWSPQRRRLERKKCKDDLLKGKKP